MVANAEDVFERMYRNGNLDGKPFYYLFVLYGNTLTLHGNTPKLNKPDSLFKTRRVMHDLGIPMIASTFNAYVTAIGR